MSDTQNSTEDAIKGPNPDEFEKGASEEAPPKGVPSKDEIKQQSKSKRAGQQSQKQKNAQDIQRLGMQLGQINQMVNELYQNFQSQEIMILKTLKDKLELSKEEILDLRDEEIDPDYIDEMNELMQERAQENESEQTNNRNKDTTEEVSDENSSQ